MKSDSLISRALTERAREKRSPSVSDFVTIGLRIGENYTFRRIYMNRDTFFKPNKLNVTRRSNDDLINRSLLRAHVHLYSLQNYFCKSDRFSHKCSDIRIRRNRLQLKFYVASMSLLDAAKRYRHYLSTDWYRWQKHPQLVSELSISSKYVGRRILATSLITHTRPMITTAGLIRSLPRRFLFSELSRVGLMVAVLSRQSWPRLSDLYVRIFGCPGGRICSIKRGDAIGANLARKRESSRKFYHCLHWARFDDISDDPLVWLIFLD